MAGVESYNPERRNTNMAEGTPGPGAEGASPQGETTPAAGAPKVAEGQFPPRPAWQIYNGFDRGKLEKDEYEFRIENPDSPYTLIVDPSSIDPDTKKPKVVAKILTIAGGAWGLFGRRQDQPQSGQDQQGNQGVPGPGQPETQAEIQGDVPEPTTAVNQTAAEGEAAVSPVPESPEKPPEQVAEGGGGGDNGERNGGQEPPPGQPPEGPRGPEPPRGPEWETSPERGRWLVEQIVYMETKLPYEVRYNAENGPKLNEYYAKLEQFVERTQEDRHKEKAFDPVEEHQVKPEEGEELLQAIQRTYDEWLKDGVKGREEAQPPENLSKLAPLRELITNFDNAYFPSPTVSEADRAKAIAERTNTVAELLKYFREADRRGILVGVNMILDSIYENIVSGKREQEEVRALADQQTVKSAQNERPSAYNSAEYSFASRLMGDPDVERLFNVWDPFLKLARMRLESEINQQEWIPLEGEWRPTSWGSGEEETTETFWSPYGGYPDYYIVSARTPAQFRRAMESFIEIIRNGSLGYAPADLFQNIQNFQRVFSARASLMAREHEAKAKSEQRPIGPDDMTLDISIEDRQELQGRAYLWYSYYQYEHYNKEEAKSGATAMALNEGPARHTAVLRSGAEGEVGSGTWDYDYLRAIELALNAQGSRGQLGNYTPAQEYLRDTIFKMQVEKRMGVVLKDYDRRDIASSTDFTARKKRDERLEAIDRYLRRHRGNLNTLSEEDRDYYLHQKAHASRNRYHIGIHQSAEEMRSLYEGFDHGDAHRRVYQEFKGLPPEELKKLPRKLLKSFRLGMVQSMMDQVRGEIRKGIRIDKQDYPVKAVFRKSDDLLEITINRLVEEGQIEEKEKGLYRRIY
ncbi:hypothetical protein HY384_01830, partial [Candidatus Daviesbacteria bacterium]|nr:hypothetical protein [Candidatus Daviesbacteria bacterium]